MCVYVWHDFIPVSPGPAPHIPVPPGDTHPNFNTFFPHKFSISSSHYLYLECSFILSPIWRTAAVMGVFHLGSKSVHFWWIHLNTSLVCVWMTWLWQIRGTMKTLHWLESKQAAFLILLCELPTQSVMWNLCGILFTILQKLSFVCIYAGEKTGLFYISQMSL